MQIELKNVTKYYYDNGKSTKGLEGINLSFKTDGSFVAVTGESGAGKTTLIKIITGIEDFDEGEIYFDKEPISGADDKRRNRLYSDNVSFVFQDYSLIESLTAEENIVLALLKKGYKVKKAKQKAVEVLKQVGLSKQIKMKASKLSGGEKQRVAIARSLSLDSKIVVFDEPTGNLDDQTSKGIIDLIQSIRPGRLIIYITHDIDIVKPYITRHITLADGHVIDDEQVNANIYADVPTIKEESKDIHKLTYLYATFLMNFKKIGRTLSSFFLVLFSTAIVLGIFTFAGSLTTQTVSSGNSDANVFTSPLGSEVFLAKENPKALDISTDKSEAVDQGSLLLTNKVYLYNENSLSMVSKEQGLMPYLDALPVILNSDETSGFSFFEGDNSDLKDNEFTFLFSNTYAKYLKSSSYYSVVSGLVGKMVGVANETLTYSNDKSVYDSDILSTRDSLTDEEFNDHIARIPRLKLENIKTTEKNTGSSSSSAFNNRNYFYLSIIVNKNTFNTLRSFYDGILDINVKKGVKYFRISSEFGNSADGLTIKDNDDFSVLTNTNNFNKVLTYDRTKYGLVLPSYYKDRNVTLVYKNLTYDVDTFDPLYLDEDYTTGVVKGSYHINFPLIQKMTVSKKLMTALYFKNAKSAKDFVSSAKQTGIRINYGNDVNTLQSTYKITDFKNQDVALRISYMMAIMSMLIAFLAIMMIIRVIISKFYYRKNDDQKVLTLIGYSLKDNMIINMVQFAIIFLISTIIVYPIWFAFVPLSGLMFKAIPGILVFLTLIDFLLVMSLGLPTRKRRNTL